jgi:predicted TIM-barrel fold metal-dependent hydrolase
MIAPQDSIDCHAHVFACDLPMVADARYRPTVDAPLDRYLDLLDRYGLARGVLVQPSFLGTDNGFMLDALARYPDRLIGVAVVEPRCGAGELAALHRAGVRGLRFNLIGRPLPDFGTTDLQRFVERVADAGLHLELHAEGAAWPVLLPPLLGTGVTLVVDHFGRPAAADPTQDAGFAAVLAEAASPDVWIKLSAPYRFAAPASAAVRAILDAAGPERLVWGSDWPWTQHPEITDYGALLAAFVATVGDERLAAQILRGNAARLYWRAGRRPVSVQSDDR